jgi:hypothetical protein
MVEDVFTSIFIIEYIDLATKRPQNPKHPDPNIENTIFKTNDLH